MIVAQIFAVIIFVGMFILIVLDKIERHYVTLGSGLLTLIVVFGICMRNGTAILNTLAFKDFLQEISGIRSRKARAQVLTGQLSFLLQV